MVAPATPRETVLAALASGRTRTQVAADLGLSYWQVTRLATRAGRPIAPAARAEGWEPQCMEPDEWTAWQGTNRRLTLHDDQAARPCADCLAGYAADMRAQGRCNGDPAGDHKDDEEETMEPTPRQVECWNAYHLHGGQSPAGAALGVTQAGVRSGIVGYMRAVGMPMPIPTPDARWIVNEGGVTSDPLECKETPGPVAYGEVQPRDEGAPIIPETIPVAETIHAVSEPELVSEHPSVLVDLISSAQAADPLALIDRELDRLAAEDAALVEQARAIVQARTDVAARIERVRAAADVIRELAGRAA